MKRSNTKMSLCVVILSSLIAIWSCKQKEPELSEQEIKEIASKEYNIPVESIELLTRTKATYRWIGQAVAKVKLRDKRNENGFELVIDSLKNVANQAELSRLNQESFTQKYGKFEPALFKLLNRAPEDTLIKVGVWAVTKPKSALPDDRLRKSGNLREGQAHRRQLYQNSRAQNQQLLKNIVDSISQQDIRVQYVCETTPLVFVEASPNDIREIASRDDVEFIYLARVGEDFNNTAIPSVAGSAWPTSGFEGSGVRVAIIEDDGIDFSNPFLAAAFGGQFQPDNTNLGHPTQTAGVVASSHVVYRGMSPQVTLLSGNGGTYDAADIIAATDWAVGTANADVLNCSFGYPVGDADHDLISRYFDHIVWNDWRSVTPAAGNSGTTLGAPGVALNVLSVGGIDDMDTPWHGDDVMYVNTSWQDPPSLHDDREKPEVCAVATKYLTTEDTTYFQANGQWITLSGGGHNGTSYAAPSVAGLIARLIDRTWYLFTWPEEVKAIVMASAARQVDDATVDTDNSAVDVKEGVGTIVVPFAEKVVSQNWHFGTYITSASFPYYYTFYAEKGDIVRFVICWDAHTDAAYTTVSLEADLDLWVYQPSGALLTYSVSWDNPYEIVEFTAPATGNYQARVYDWRFDGTYEWLGLAWSRR